MRLANLRIRTKLSFIIAFTLISFVVVTALYTLILQVCLSQNQALRDREFQIQQLANEVALQMLQARRAEKDFLLYREAAQVERVVLAAREAIQRANGMMRLSREAGHPEVEAKAAQIVQAMEAYVLAFQSLAKGQIEVGLTEESGLHGRLRQNAHSLESLFRLLAPERMVPYLELRRAEKDYLLRRDAQDATSVRVLLRTVREGLGDAERAEGEPLLADYAQAFDTLLTHDQENGVLLASLRGAVHPVEPLSEQIRQLSMAAASRMAADTQSFGERSSVLLLLFSLLTVAVCGVVCAVTIRSVTRSLEGLQHFSREVAAGRWEAVVPGEGGDEMGQLAEAMRTMLQRVHEVRLLSDRLLLIMVLIGRGVIPEKGEGMAQGEFRQVSVALNGMIDTLDAVRLVTRQMEQLNQAVLPDRLDESRFEGEFRQMTIAMNRLIDRQRGVQSA